MDKIHWHQTPPRKLTSSRSCSLNGKLCIIRNNMSITLIDISDPTTVTEVDSAHMWEAFARKGQHRSFMANLWSTITGRNLKTDIMHCQVLQVWVWPYVKQKHKQPWKAQLEAELDTWTEAKRPAFSSVKFTDSALWNILILARLHPICQIGLQGIENGGRRKNLPWFMRIKGCIAAWTP